MIPRTRTPLQMFAEARRIVGVASLPMRQGERATHVSIAKDAISVVLSVETWRDVRGGVKVTHRGTKILLFTRQCNTSRWRVEVLMDELNKLETPVYMLSLDESELDQLERKKHERMCYRPGNNRYPMDGPVRRAALSD